MKRPKWVRCRVDSLRDRVAMSTQSENDTAKFRGLVLWFGLSNSIQTPPDPISIAEAIWEPLV